MEEDDIEDNGRRDWESGKDLERSWSLGPKQDVLEMLPGSRVLLKEGKEISTSAFWEVEGRPLSGSS
jgi:hypothetical protein